MILCQQLNEGGRLFWTQFFEYFTILGLVSLGGYSLYKAYKGEKLWVFFNPALLQYFLIKLMGEKRVDIVNDILYGAILLFLSLYFLWEKLESNYNIIPSIDINKTP